MTLNHGLDTSKASRRLCEYTVMLPRQLTLQGNQKIRTNRRVGVATTKLYIIKALN